MLPLIRKYGLALGLKVWSLRRRCRRPSFSALILQQLRRRAKREDRRKNHISADILRTIIRDITPPSRSVGVLGGRSLGEAPSPTSQSNRSQESGVGNIAAANQPRP